MGGVKRKIPIEMIGKKDSRAVAFSKRTKGLYSEAAEICLHADAQIAILATPVSSNSNVSFYSFGHSSVDNVVAAFLANKRPREDLGLGLGFWWEDERLAKSEDPEELRDAMNSMSKMLQYLKELRRDCEDVEKKGLVDKTHQNHTLNPESCCDNKNNYALLGNVEDGCNQELLDIDQIINFESTSSSVNSELENISMVTPNQNSFSDSKAIVDEELVVHTDLYDDIIHLSNLDEDVMLPISDNNNNNNNNNVLSENFDEFIQELDLDQIFDFETNYMQSLEMDGVSMVTTNSETVGHGGLLTHIDLDEDNLCFSDYFNELTSPDPI
ncbi:PREDICTED: agamous-like MADS-box protein AGL97 [Camelina sativa]|uniref:Agamous-like MADS-box protein AGL97 n=1 Tax=Camelina sativa TaxID=90675 RepID=A0ABM0ZES5_CAMSA|nr:PREDICTED: agamous-like MADS-box protein AGL97 [Camelina sativa]XP_010514742.1 PREDICTED: agamous-like MADS-box protein AGL97 [Camelina sativa]